MCAASRENSWRASLILGPRLDHGQQLEVGPPQHHGVIGGAKFGVAPARGERKAEPAIGRGGPIEVPDGEHGMIEVEHRGRIIEVPGNLSPAVVA